MLLLYYPEYIENTHIPPTKAYRKLTIPRETMDQPRSGHPQTTTNC